MKNKNSNCTGPNYLKHLLKRLVYGTPIRCGTVSTNQHTMPEYPIVYEREVKPAIPRRAREEVLF